MKKLLFALLLFTSAVNAQTDSLRHEFDLMLDRQELFVKTHNAGIVAMSIGFAGMSYCLLSKQQDESIMIASGCMVTTGIVINLYAPNVLRKRYVRK